MFARIFPFRRDAIKRRRETRNIRKKIAIRFKALLLSHAFWRRCGIETGFVALPLVEVWNTRFSSLVLTVRTIRFSLSYAVMSSVRTLKVGFRYFALNVPRLGKLLIEKISDKPLIWQAQDFVLIHAKLFRDTVIGPIAALEFMTISDIASTLCLPRARLWRIVDAMRCSRSTCSERFAQLADIHERARAHSSHSLPTRGDG